jgi:hypothetical protein
VAQEIREIAKDSEGILEITSVVYFFTDSGLISISSAPGRTVVQNFQRFKESASALREED